MASSSASHEPSVSNGVPKTLAEHLNIEPPCKLPFEKCYKDVELAGLLHVPAPDGYFVAESDQQTADFLDMPLTLELPSGPTHTVFLIHEHMDQSLVLDHSHVLRLLSSHSYSDLPTPLCPTTKILTKFLMDVHVLRQGSGIRYVVKHLHFETPVSAAWVKGVFHSDSVSVAFPTKGQCHPKQFAKSLHFMLERMPGQHYFHKELIIPSDKKRREDEKKLLQQQEKAEQPKLPASARPNATAEDVIHRQKGYAYIIKYGPNSNKHSEQNIYCIYVELALPTC